MMIMKNLIILYLLATVGSVSVAQVSIHPQIGTASIIGVAPMPVFFDATTTTINDSLTNPFHELYYQWNFGDFFSGFWTNIPKSKNRASHPIAAHVFDSIGLHIVELEVFKNSSYSVQKPFIIKIQSANDFYKNEKTVCFSVNGEFSDAPDNAILVSINDLDEVKPYLSDSTRLLFRRGDVISTTTGLDFSNLKYLTVGAFGPRLNIDSFEIAENAPIIEMIGNEPVFILGNTDTSQQSRHLKITDINIYNKNKNNRNSAIVANGATAFNLLYRLKIKDFAHSIFYNDQLLETESYSQERAVEPFKEIFIANCIIENNQLRGDMLQISGERIAIIGNHFNNNRLKGNILNLKWSEKGIVSNNHFLHAGIQKHCLKITAPNYDFCSTVNHSTKEVIISDNHFETENAVNEMILLAKENEADKTLNDFIIDRNYLNALNDKRVKIGILASANNLTIRNNIINGSGGNRRHFTGIFIKNEFDTQLNNIKITNNTIFKQDWVNLMTGIQINPNVHHTFIANNLVYSPNAMDLRIINDLGKYTTDQKNIYPFVHPFIKESPSHALDFQLDSVSLVLDNGVKEQIALRDFFEKERSSSSRVDIGAFQFTHNPITTYSLGSIASADLDQIAFGSSRYHTIDMSKFTSKYSVEVYNENGELIREDQNLRDMFYTLQTESYLGGIYWLKISSKNVTVMSKIFIRR
jgi:hypothetical protein